MLNDADGDDIPDYLDKEPNTAVGARVNSIGMTLDSDGDGTRPTIWTNIRFYLACNLQADALLRRLKISLTTSEEHSTIAA